MTLQRDLDERPFPGAELAARVTGDEDRERFFTYGRQSIAETTAVLGILDRGFSDYKRILDFGAGCGRMLTWLEDVAAAGSDLFATDIDADAIAWITEHLPFATAKVNQARPPLDYPDGFFDLVYNHSVFTHLTEELQDAWLGELRRVTRPGAHLVLTVHGEHAFAKYEDACRLHQREAPREAFDTHGFVFVSEPAWQHVFPDWYGSTYHSTRYLFAHWSRWFRIRAYVPRGVLDFQDMVLLERRDDDDDADAYLLAQGDHVEAGEPELEPLVDVPRARALLARGTDVSSRSRFGPLGGVWRRVLRVALRNYAAYQREVDASLLAAINELDERTRSNQDPTRRTGR